MAMTEADGINGIMESLGTRKEKIHFIQVRHEEDAVKEMV